jgi:hypothetical protein
MYTMATGYFSLRIIYASLYFSDTPASHAISSMSTDHGRCSFLVEILALKLRYNTEKTKIVEVGDKPTYSKGKGTWKIQKMQETICISLPDFVFADWHSIMHVCYTAGSASC